MGIGNFLKEYLEYYNISQTEFANRLNVSQKHMNELLNGKTNITLEMANEISNLTDIPVDFIIKSENRKNVKLYLDNKFSDMEELDKYLKKNIHMNELKKREWVEFNNITSPVQNYMDIIKFLKVRNLEALEKVNENTLFKKQGEDIIKLSLWIARAEQLVKEQKVNDYDKNNLEFLVKDLIEFAYKEEDTNIEELTKLLNSYGFYFVIEKALDGTKVRGCFKVKRNNPAIYITKNYKAKDSLYFELFHELGHCKSDYNEAKNKVIVEATEEQEKRADKFAIDRMIKENIWKEIEKDYSENSLISISNKYRIPMSFIVGRLAKFKYIKYNSDLYNKYKMS